MLPRRSASAAGPARLPASPGTSCRGSRPRTTAPTRTRRIWRVPPSTSSSTARCRRKADPVRWLFVSRRCMHCDDAGCMKICPAPGALYRTAEGAVAYDRDKCIGCKLCVNACPFDVPRYDAEGKMTKCHLCFDRIGAGMQPACVKTCPTGALRFGDRDELISTAKKEGLRHHLRRKGPGRSGLDLCLQGRAQALRDEGESGHPEQRGLLAHLFEAALM